MIFLKELKYPSCDVACVQCHADTRVIAGRVFWKRTHDQSVVAEKREHPGYYSVVRPPGPEIPARRKRNNSW